MNVANVAKKSKILLSHIPLWMQLVLFTASTIFIFLSLLIYNDYKRNKEFITQTQKDASSKLLTMEMQNLENYIDELSLFSVQSCYDRNFTQIIEQDSPISVGEDIYIKKQLRAYYYSRNDVQHMDFYFMNHNEKYFRTSTGFMSCPFVQKEITDSDYYNSCVSSPYFHAIFPAEDSHTLFHYYHSLLRIKTKKPQALLHIKISDSYWKSFVNNHTEKGEFLCLLSDEGDLIYSDHPDWFTSDTQLSIINNSNAFEKDSFYYTKDQQTYLVTSAAGDKYPLRLLAFLPTSYIDNQISEIRNSILLNGILMSVFIVLLIIALIRYLTRPLSILSNKLVDVGKGDFTSPANISGSLEISNLSQSFNDMIQHIDDLIKKTYVAQLGEKTARITALEAQLNPHFLYNTLQAIATEALLNDQQQIYTMITSLASGLRYTIKGGDYVPLYKEMEYTKNYLNLQELRMGHRLHVSFEIDPDTEKLLIPKISIQTLVENSIIHGLGSSNDSISICICSYIDNDYLFITIQDNGCGIDEMNLQKIKESFHSTLQNESQCIGLSNLYGRLHLLYQDKADMVIDTKLNVFTKITLIIPVTKEDILHV